MIFMDDGLKYLQPFLKYFYYRLPGFRNTLPQPPPPNIRKPNKTYNRN